MPTGILSDDKARVWFVDMFNAEIGRVDDLDGSGRLVFSLR